MATILSANRPTRLSQAFHNNFEILGELGASVSIWQHGQEIIGLHRGYANREQTKPWSARTLVPVYSATKGPASACLLLALYEHGATPFISIGDLWPRFPMPHATIAQVMSHQCGLAGLSRSANLFDQADCVAAIEETPCAWAPPIHGYHPHTFGPIMDEIMIRLTGNTIAAWWEARIRKPFHLDLYMDTPEACFPRIATLYPGKAEQSQLSSDFYRAYLKPGTPIFRAFHSLQGINTVRQMNSPMGWLCTSPAYGGIASAHALAKFYQICLGNLTLPGSQKPFFPDEVRTWMSTIITDGFDQTMLTRTAFSCGFMMDPRNPQTGMPLRNLFGFEGFGHAGAGGSHAFGDPATGISFAYTMNHMDLHVLPGQKTQMLVYALMGFARQSVET